MNNWLKEGTLVFLKDGTGYLEEENPLNWSYDEKIELYWYVKKVD